MKQRHYIALPVFLLGIVLHAWGGSSMEKLFQPFVDSGRMAGAVVLVADVEKLLALEAVGYADLTERRPMKTDALFWIASQTKTITAAGILLLLDEGKLSLDDPVEKYLPEFKGIKVEIKHEGAGSTFRTPSREITIREILSHTSGVVGGHRYYDLNLRVADIVAEIAKGPLDYDPGSNYKYSGAGFSTAGRIIEVVSGKSYAEFLQARLFDPLGMKQTTFWPTVEQQKEMARAYHFPKDNEGIAPQLITDYRIAGELADRNRLTFPGGGLFSTAEEVALFLRMLLNRGAWKGQQILSESSVAEMAKIQTEDGKGGWLGGAAYGLGTEITKNGFGHEGAFKTEGWVEPDRKIVRVLLVQIEGRYPYTKELKEAFARYTDEVLRSVNH